MGAGIVIGYLIGLGMGVAIVKKQKSWSKLSKQEKNLRGAVLFAMTSLVILGAILVSVIKNQICLPTFGL